MRTVLIRIMPYLYIGFIWYLSGKPSDAVMNTGLSYDMALKEALHLVEFALLYGLLVLARLTQGELTPAANRRALLLAIAYGFVDELHQYFIPYRSAELIDLAKDTGGVIIAWLFIQQAFFRSRHSRIRTVLKRIAAAPEQKHHQ